MSAEPEAIKSSTLGEHKLHQEGSFHEHADEKRSPTDPDTPHSEEKMDLYDPNM